VIYGHRSPAVVVAILAALKAGSFQPHNLFVYHIYF
jgi:hypothetical protein